MNKEFVYVCHMFGNDIVGNSKKINEICRDIAINENKIPLAPYLHFIQFLDDKNQNERDLGLGYNFNIIEALRQDIEFRICGEDSVLTDGMRKEIEKAMELGLEINYKCSKTLEDAVKEFIKSLKK